MIEIITGKPGSGKTYLAVSRMLELPVGKYVIWHNIKGLKPESFPEPAMVKCIPDDVVTWCGKANQIEWADACQEKYGRPMLVVIDEAQMIFADRNKDLKGWLSWHRHLGQDIWLIAQHSRMLHQDYFNLAEYEVRAVRSLLLNFLVYQYRMGGEAFKTVRKSRDKKVFAAYQSFDQTEVAKKSFRLVYWVGAFVLMAVLAFWGLMHWFSAGAASASERKSPAVSARGSSRSASASAPGPGLKPDLPPDPWKEVSYQGAMGTKVFVSYQGHLMDLGDAVEEPYHIEKVSTSSCVVLTRKGRHTIRKKPVTSSDLPEVPGRSSQERAGQALRGTN